MKYSRISKQFFGKGNGSRFLGFAVIDKKRRIALCPASTTSPHACKYVLDISHHRENKVIFVPSSTTIPTVFGILGLPFSMTQLLLNSSSVSAIQERILDEGDPIS